MTPVRIEGCSAEFSPLAGAAPVQYAVVNADQWRAACTCIARDGGRLVALWGAESADAAHPPSVNAALAAASGLLLLKLPVPGRHYPDLSDIYPSADRMQRAARDLSGLVAEGAADGRRWLRHGAWGADEFPLRKDFVRGTPDGPDRYDFVQVAGDGVHEIPIGPVHTGTIEPGHFRFSIVGERVLRLEERLGYKHKGIEKRFEDMDVIQGARLAGRISGDTTVAYAWAYAMAVESATGMTPPPRALWLRALLLERERIANHLGDLGFLGNDAGLSFGLTQFSCLKEDLLRLNQALFGHRYLMDAVVPGGVARDPDAGGAARIRAECDVLARTVTGLKSIYDEHPGLQDRFITCGRVEPPLAAQLGLIGLAGRASGQAWDLRVEYPCVPYGELDVNMATHRNGDVAARVIMRFEEIFESLRLTRLILERMPPGDIAAPVPIVAEGARGAGWIEGWRGEVFVALEAGRDNHIWRLHPHDPSWQNWPLLEHAALGNIVPDFPLINKSFNLSYSGQDL